MKIAGKRSVSALRASAVDWTITNEQSLCH